MDRYTIDFIALRAMKSMGVLGLKRAPWGPVQGLCSSRHKLLYIFTFSIFFFYIEWNFHANALQWNFRAGMRELCGAYHGMVINNAQSAT